MCHMDYLVTSHAIVYLLMFMGITLAQIWDLGRLHAKVLMMMWSWILVWVDLVWMVMAWDPLWKLRLV